MSECIGGAHSVCGFAVSHSIALVNAVPSAFLIPPACRGFPRHSQIGRTAMHWAALSAWDTGYSDNKDIVVKLDKADSSCADIRDKVRQPRLSQRRS